jgi:hypothetical protein
MPRVPRSLLLLFAIGVGVLFAVGLFTHGAVGGILLVLTDAALIGLARSPYANLREQGRPIRIVVVAGIAVLAVVKLAGKA